MTDKWREYKQMKLWNEKEPENSEKGSPLTDNSSMLCCTSP